jgi:hypothetical protein
VAVRRRQLLGAFADRLCVGLRLIRRLREDLAIRFSRSPTGSVTRGYRADLHGASFRRLLGAHNWPVVRFRNWGSLPSRRQLGLTGGHGRVSAG